MKIEALLNDLHFEFALDSSLAVHTGTAPHIDAARRGVTRASTHASHTHVIACRSTRHRIGDAMRRTERESSTAAQRESIIGERSRDARARLDERRRCSTMRGVEGVLSPPRWRVRRLGRARVG